MKYSFKLITLICFFYCNNKIQAQIYEPLQYSYNGTTTYGVKIKTNIPYCSGCQMPTLRFEGYNFGENKNIGLILTWYIYNDIFYQSSLSSFGSHTPKIFLSKENGKVVIFLDDRGYYQRFKVAAFAQGMGEQASWFQNWITADEAINGNNTVEVPYQNTFTGKVGIGTTNPVQKLQVNNSVLIAPYSPGETGGYLDNVDARLTILDGNIYDGVHGGITFGGLHVNNGTRMQASYNSINFGQGYLRITNNQEEKILIGSGIEWGNQNVIINPNTGNLGIGTMSPSEKLSVNGNIRAKKLIITQTSWSDYVFGKNYKLRTLSEVENYIKANQHLPDVPSAKEVSAKGISVGDTQALLLKKIEELTLYVIELEKRLQKVESNKK